MKQINHLQRIRFGGLIPGEYKTVEGQVCNLHSLKDLGFLSLEETSKKLAGSLFSAEEPTVRSFEPKKGVDAVLGDVDSSIKYASGPIKTGIKRVVRGTKPEIKKPEDVIKLENILSSTYDTDVAITSINELPITKKQVKEVFFLHDDLLSKVWVFKADPGDTAKELVTYHIIHEQGVPTGKPIGYTPNIKSIEEGYPYDIAILGGVVEHAGEPYNELVKNMALEPLHIFNTAVSIAQIIGNCHSKLTSAKSEFEKYGINIEKASPKKEIKKRFLAGLNIREKDAENLIKAFEELYNKQSNSYVVSHGDIHTGNIVTINKPDKITNQIAVSIKDFGIIDWDSIGFDNPYSDLQDFWIHHQREATNVCGSYDFGFNQLLGPYIESFNSNGKGLYFDLRDSKIDSLIQSVWGHFKELYDPIRKDKKEIEKKAIVHYNNLLNNLDELEKFGCKKQSYTIKKELKRLLKDKTYLQN